MTQKCIQAHHQYLYLKILKLYLNSIFELSKQILINIIVIMEKEDPIFPDPHDLNHRGISQILEQSQRTPELALHCARYFHSLSQFCLAYAAKEKRQGQTHKRKFIRKHPKNDMRSRPNNQITAEPPKKPLTAYIIYFQDKKSVFVERFPSLNLSQLTKLIAKEWKELPEGDKKSYLDRAAQDRKRFDEQLVQFKKFYDFAKPEMKHDPQSSSQVESEPEKHTPQ